MSEIWLARAERISGKLGLRPTGAKLLAVLLAHDLAAPDAMLAALESRGADPAASLKVQLCWLRQRIAPARIDTVFSGGHVRAMPRVSARGYRLSADDKAALLALAGPDPVVDPNRIAVPRAWRLSKVERALAEALLNRDRHLSTIAAMEAMTNAGAVSVSKQYLGSAMFRVRQELARHGVRVETRYGVGYRIAPEERARLAGAGKPPGRGP